MEFRRLSLRPLSLLALLAATSLSLAEIGYRVEIQPEREMLEITMTIPVSGENLQLQMPNWAPGSYRLVDSFENVRNLVVLDDNKQPPRVVQDKNTWSVTGIDGETLTVRYGLPTRLTANSIQYSGPSTYLYVVGRKTEPATLEIAAPRDWKVAVGLDEMGPNRFAAPDYDVLADNPVSAGDLIIDTYTSFGKPHYIVLRGETKEDVDRQYLLRACKHVSDSQGHFFGGLPFNKYVWHFTVTDRPDGAGGLEHLSSTTISLASGVGPRAVGVIAHEYFHLWNVKRIRSKPLGPFDYTQLPKTGALWWLEGVDDYYGHLLLHRYGWSSQDQFFGNIVSNVGAIRRNAAFKEVGAHEASLRVGETNNGRGNSNGYRISYYNLGFVAGMLLDIEMRSLTNNRHSLDDVELALWEMTKDNQPGFEEDAIEKLMVRFGGAEMGEFYQKVVMRAGEMPIDETLAKIGLQISEVDEKFTNHGISGNAIRDRGYEVRDAVGPAQGKLQRGDLIVAVNGTALSGTARRIQEGLEKAAGDVKPGETLKLQVKRGEQTMNVDVVTVEGTRKVQRLIDLPNLTESQRRLRGQYLHKVSPATR